MKSCYSLFTSPHWLRAALGSLGMVLSLFLPLSMLAGSRSQVSSSAIVRGDSISRLAPLSQYLSGRSSTRWIVSQPMYGVLDLRHGATIFVVGDTPIASLQPLQPKAISPLSDTENGLGLSSIRIKGRSLYLSDVADLISITDITGRVVKTYRNSRQAMFDMSAGVYVLRIQVRERSLVCKIVLR